MGQMNAMRYYYFFKRNPLVKILVFVDFIALCATSMAHVAMYSMLIKLQAPIFLISLVVMMNFLPIVFIAPITGSIIEKVAYRPLLIWCLLIESVVAVAFLSVDSLDKVGWLMALLFIKMGLVSLTFNGFMSLMPKILTNEDLRISNEIASMLWSLCFSIGMVLGGFITDIYGEATTFIVSGALFFIGALVVYWRVHISTPIKSSTKKMITLIKEGITYLKKHPLAIHLMILHACIGLTIFDTLLAALADTMYKEVMSAALTIGLINGIRAVALLIGPMLIGKWVTVQNFFYLIFLQGLAIILWAVLQKDFYNAFIGVFLTGFFTTTIWSYSYYLLQQNIDEDYLGRAIAYNDMLFQTSCILTTLFLGWSLSFISPQWVTASLGVGFILFALYYLWIQKNYNLHKQ